MPAPSIDPTVPPRLEDDKTLPIVAYALLIAGVATGGVTCLIALILAYVSRKNAPAWLASHYEFQIRTVWLALGFSIVAGLTSMLAVGLLLFVALGLWLVVRGVVGLSTLLKGQPYPTPKAWML